MKDVVKKIEEQLRSLFFKNNCAPKNHLCSNCNHEPEIHYPEPYSNPGYCIGGCDCQGFTCKECIL